MGLFGRNVFSARVGFWGLREDDAVPFRAAVRHAKPPFLPERERNALALLIPLTAVRVLYASAGQYFVEAMMRMVGEAAEIALEDEERARGLTMRDLAAEFADFYEVEPTGIDLLDHKAAFIKGVPEVVSELPKRAEQEFQTDLRSGRKGYWAKIHAPRRGPAFFSAFGLLALMEQTANNAPYEEITVPSMAALAVLQREFDNASEEEWATVETMLSFQKVLSDVVLAPDPR